jgi:hypothetical protein
MRTLLIGDVHGCADELRELLTWARPTRTILVGDVFTKGPDPVGVWQLIQQYQAESVMGNHDDWILKIAEGRVPAKPKHRAIYEPMDAQAPGWRAWVAALPLFLELEDFTVVHAGLHPSGRTDLTTEAMALLMRRYPMDEPNALHWHEQYTASKGVIFGHDAKQGLLYKTRDGKPWIIGLDTGCVYGHRLTGYLLEEDQLIHVPAARIYQPIDANSQD